MDRIVSAIQGLNHKQDVDRIVRAIQDLTSTLREGERLATRLELAQQRTSNAVAGSIVALRTSLWLILWIVGAVWWFTR